MPQLSSRLSTSPVKMLLIGDAGAGKTSALASLANAGYRLRIIDLDNNCGPLETYCNPDTDVSIFSVSDSYDIRRKSMTMGLGSGAALSSKRIRAFDWTAQVLDGWSIKQTEEGWWQPCPEEEAEENLGPPMSWGTDHVLVIDSLSFLGNAAMRKAQTEGGGNNQSPTGLHAAPKIHDYGWAQKLMEGVIEAVSGSMFSCHVICTTHLTYQEDEDGLKRAFPSIGKLGKATTAETPRYFDTMVWARAKRASNPPQRIIDTVGDSLCSCKNPLGDRVSRELPLSTGLATYFAARTGHEAEGSVSVADAATAETGSFSLKKVNT